MADLFALDQRFWSKVAIGAPDECWEWQAALFTSTGYGLFEMSEGSRGAHRVAALLAFGPSDEFVLHSCDNRPCVNPRHLRYGTQKDNMRDRLRGVGYARGEANNLSKLTTPDVLELRRLYDTGLDTCELGRRFGISQTGAWAIVTSKTWKHLPAVTRTERVLATHCRQGHIFDEANTYVATDGARRCRKCVALRARAYYARKHAVPTTLAPVGLDIAARSTTSRPARTSDRKKAA